MFLIISVICEVYRRIVPALKSWNKANSTLPSAQIKQQYKATTMCHISFLSYKHSFWGLPPSLTLHHCNLH